MCRHSTRQLMWVNRCYSFLYLLSLHAWLSFNLEVCLMMHLIVFDWVSETDYENSQLCASLLGRALRWYTPGSWLNAHVTEAAALEQRALELGDPQRASELRQRSWVFAPPSVTGCRLHPGRAWPWVRSFLQPRAVSREECSCEPSATYLPSSRNF